MIGASGRPSAARTGANERRWIGDGPKSSGVGGRSRPSRGRPSAGIHAVQRPGPLAHDRKQIAAGAAHHRADDAHHRVGGDGRVEVGVGSDGRPIAWNHVIVGQSLLADTPFAVMMKDNIDPTTVEGVNDTHYALDNFHVWVHNPKVNVPVLWWRSV